ncbi:putative pectate lyase C [Paramyrothecium foliicola]|nr:putative pectate lyase C [Paramyrothecium foliicola]
MKNMLVTVGLLLAGLAGVGAQEAAPSAPSTNVRYRFIAPAVRPMNEYETEYRPWPFKDGNSSTITGDNVEYTVSGNGLKGGWHRINYARWVPHYGERLASAGLTSASGPITLTIKGLPEGTHRLKTWHNAWDAIKTTAVLGISVNGEVVASNISQSIRLTNIWETAQSYVNLTVTSADQALEITYTPTGADNKVWLNGFEIDGPPTAAQISFPVPIHLDERIHAVDGKFEASWEAAKLPSAKYNVYLGTEETDLKLVGENLADTKVSFKDLNTFDTYYWRVDVISSCGSQYIGRVWMFRLAQLAFPGAEGHGRFARGGRGGKVVKVTSLEDTTDPGTLRHALLSIKGPRIIVFDVGGVITLKSRLSLNTEWGRYVTLAGQTAPGKGIVLQGHPFGLSGANDVIWRHIRVRPGKVSGVTVDGMGMAGSNHCIFDRCSVGWGIDESFSSRSAHNITFQRSMISEPLNVAGHKNYPEGKAHGFSATIGGDIGTFHHNLLAHAEGRSWSMGGGTDYDGFFAGRLDIRNNVVYNFGGRVNDGGAHEVNFVNNLYKQGPASSLTYAMRAQFEDGLPGTQQYYCAGNSMPGVFTQDSVQYVEDGTGQTKNIACYADVTINPPPQYQKFVDEPFFESYVDTQSSTEAYKRVLSDSGASQPVFDDHDKRIINETLTKTYTYVGSKTGKKGLIDDPADVGGLEDFPTATRDAEWDADNDGIADWWDGSTGGDGWTPIEGYLNWMADPHVFVAPSESVTFNVAQLAAGFKSPTFTVTGETKGSVTVSGSEITYKAASAAGIERLTLEIADEEGSEWSRPFGVAIV